MSSIALITSLPTCLSSSALSDWTELKGLARIDSAYCNRNTRHFLLDLLRSDECINNPRCRVSDSTILTWMVARGIKVSSVIVSVDEVLNCAVLAKYLELTNLYINTALLYQHQVLDTASYYLPFTNLIDLIFPLTENTCYLLANNPRLQRLNVTVDPSSDTCKALVSVFPVSLLELNSLLVRLDMHKPALQADACLLSIVRMAHNLEKLNISSIFQTIEDSTWIPIAQHCPQLQKLSVTSCVSDHILAEFGRLCPYITDLRISFNTIMTDQGVLEITQQLPQLRRLCLVYCNNLTGLSLEHIANGCKTHNVYVKLGGTASMAVSNNRIQVLREKLSTIGGELDTHP